MPDLTRHVECYHPPGGCIREEGCEDDCVVLIACQAARREALEEAARVCDARGPYGDLDSLECGELAAAIRALIDSEKAPAP